MATPSGDVVTVEILGQRYPIRSSLDPTYVAQLASYVDKKMQTAADSTSSGDSVRVAVLAALNIADEFFRYRRNGTTAEGTARETAEAIEALVDEALSRAG